MSPFKRFLVAACLGFLLGGPIWIYAYLTVPPLLRAIAVRADLFFGPTVVEVTDGDTLRVRSWPLENEWKVRLLGANTPETVAPNQPQGCFGPQASAETKNLAEGRKISVGFDAYAATLDKYWRPLVYVWLPDGRLLNRTLIEEGYARENDYGSRYERREEFRLVQAEARTAKRGLWGACPRMQG